MAIIGVLVAVAVYIGLQSIEEPFRAQEETPEDQYSEQISGRIKEIDGDIFVLDVSAGRSEELPSVTFQVTQETTIRVRGTEVRTGSVADLVIGDEVTVTTKTTGSEQEAVFIEVYKTE